MRVSEVIYTFQSMPACERMYLLCQLLHKCIDFEIRYLATYLNNLLQCDSGAQGLSKYETDANKLVFFSALEKEEGENVVLSQNGISRMCCGLALVHDDNRVAGEVVYNLLSRENLVTVLEKSDSLELLEDVRLLYIMAVYHPSLSFENRKNLLMIMQKLDTIYNARLQKQEVAESEKTIADGDTVLQQSEPAVDALILSCSVKGVYKRLSDKRYPYVIAVEWSDGTVCYVHRTYGDFFSFQNKLLDLFPEESGQRHKKQRVIPFLPGRKLLSGRSNRELAEKRLPELWQYTHDLFELPQHITQCQHLIEFFRPRQSDFKDHVLPLHKMTTFSDTKIKSRHPSAPSNVLFSAPSPSSSPAVQRASAISSVGRVVHTLPTTSTNAPLDKNPDSPRERRFTLPSRSIPSAFTPVSPATSNEWVKSSESSLGSSEQLLVSSAGLATTVACTVVTPPMNRTSGSPAFSVSVSPLTSGSSSAVTYWTATTLTAATKIMPTADSPLNQSTHVSLYLTSDHVSGTSQNPKISTANWADRSDPPPPPNIDGTFFSPTAPITVSPSPTTSIGSCHKTSLPFSPALPASSYIPYSPSHCYTPSPATSPVLSPKPHTPRSHHWRDSHTPTCHTPTETDPFSKWLKAHRLHKYSNLFNNMTFEQISKLSVEQLKEKGMTQGAAKKLWQKMDELKKSNVSSFREISISSISRKPSTSSLPAALLLADRMLTPSSSIDQLSLYSSTCSLDTFAPSFSHNRANSDAMLAKFDKAIVEAGPTALVNGGSGNVTSPDSINGTGTLMNVTGEGTDAHVPGSSASTFSERSPSAQSSSDISITVSPTQQIVSRLTHARKDHLPSSNEGGTGGQVQQHSVRIPQPLVSPNSNRIGMFVGSGWSPTPVIRGRVIVAPSNLATIRPIMPRAPQYLPYDTVGVNGLLATASGSIPQVGRLGGYPATSPHQSSGAPSLVSPLSSSEQSGPQTCYNCGKTGHDGASCHAASLSKSGHIYDSKPSHHRQGSSQ